VYFSFPKCQPLESCRHFFGGTTHYTAQANPKGLTKVADINSLAKKYINNNCPV
jgi:hypothetical protein